MPELPGVEVFKRYIDSTSLHQRITDLQVNDDYVLKNIDRDAFENRIVGQSFRETHRHGKYLFLQMNGNHELLLHFGMTGFPKYFKKGDSQPDYPRILITFENGYQLAYDCKRKLGEVRIVENYRDYIEDLGLGPDAIDEELDFESFKQRFGDRHGMIKSALMNQEIIAGIGNVYSDEILFQAGIHPKSNVQNLDGDDWRNIYEVMHEVCETSIDCQANRNLLPDHYILSNREENADCPKGCNDSLQITHVSGRTTYFCPNCQELIE